MIILNKPYVSDFLVDVIKKNGLNVLDNEVARKYFSKEQLTSSIEAIKKYNQDNELFYTNSENSIDWVNENLKDTDLFNMICLSKDKYLFREKLKEVFPTYYFEKFSLDELKKTDKNKIKYPVVLKPCVGFLSFGVYPIENAVEWDNVIKRIDKDIEQFKDIFPNSVVDTANFIVEEMIEGDEYAIDAYFDKDGKATILNIFQHPFFNGKDVSDRAYYTSKAIFEKYLDSFEELLNKIGKVGNFKNFPFHLELRANEKSIIPIEINPMRFCGWCITDIAYFAWGVNVYEYYLKQKKPDWKNILKNKDNDYYYFTIGDVPNSLEKDLIKEVNYEQYLKNISNPLDIRKIDFKTNPVFAIVFAKTGDFNEIKNILSLDMKKYIAMK